MNANQLTGKVTERVFTKYAIIDGFLGPELSAQLLTFALKNEHQFSAAGVTTAETEAAVDCDARKSVEFQGELGEIGKQLEKIFRKRADELFTEAGLAPFPDPIIEMGLAAHRDGGFFRDHVDIFTDATRRFSDTDRILSAVYYFHREPAAFTGGELSIRPISGNAEPVKIAPRHDRLAIFPSFAPHEVMPLSVPGDAFADARFSVNCWFRRART